MAARAGCGLRLLMGNKRRGRSLGSDATSATNENEATGSPRFRSWEEEVSVVEVPEGTPREYFYESDLNDRLTTRAHQSNIA